MSADQIVREPAAAQAARIRSRWLVHLALASTLIVSLVPLLLFGVSPRVMIHVVVAIGFLYFVAVHLLQRRRTVARLATRFARSWRKPAGRMALSGGIFAFLLANVVASGVLDLVYGRNYMLPLPGLPHGGISWHGVSSLLFAGYLVTHVIRRRKRLRKSVIR